MRLIIPAKIWMEMMNYALLCSPNEVTGNGLIEFDDEAGALKVKEIFVPTQSVEPAFSQFSETGLHEIIMDLIEHGRADDVEALRFRWHSHGLGPVFFSSVDVADIRTEICDWVVNLVINRQGERLARLDLRKPLPIEAIPLEVEIDYYDKRVAGKCRKMIEKKVTVIKRQDALEKGKTYHGEEFFEAVEGKNVTIPWLPK